MKRFYCDIDNESYISFSRSHKGDVNVLMEYSCENLVVLSDEKIKELINYLTELVG